MARIQGMTPFAANFEVEKRGPLDARMAVETTSDLINPTTWLALDGNEYTYVGMPVSVSNDGNNNGMYVLIAPDYTDINNWLLVGSNATQNLEENWVSKFVVTSDFEVNEVIDLSTGNGVIAGTCNRFGDNIDGVDKNIGASAGQFFQEAGLNVYIQGQGELYKSVGVIFDSPTSLYFPIPLQVGDYFWIEKDAGMGISSGGGWSNAIDGTYSEIKALKDAGSLVPGQWYGITDFATSYIVPGTSDTYTGPIERIVLEAISSNRFRDECISLDYQGDDIIYNIDKDSLISSYALYGEYEDGADSGEEITINVTGQRTLTVNKSIYNDSDFYIYAENDSNSYYGTLSNYGVSRTYNDIGGGLYEIVIDNSINIDLQNPNYNYIEIQFKQILGTKKGEITNRIYKQNNIQLPYDFRGIKFRLYKIDTTGLSWDNATNYSKRYFVEYNNNIYISIQDNNLNHQPQLYSDDYWMIIFKNVNTDYLVTYYGFRSGINIIQADLNDYIEVDTFNYYDGTNYVNGIDYFSDVSSVRTDISIPNNIFITNGNNSSDIRFKKEVYNNIFRGTIFGLELGKVYGTIIDRYISNIKVDYMYDSYIYYFFDNIIGTLMKVNIKDFRDSNIGMLNMVIISSNFRENNITNINGLYSSKNFLKNNINYYSYNINILGSNFYHNDIGDISNITFTTTQDIRDNTIGRFFNFNTITGIFRENNIGNYFRYNELTSFHMNNIGDYFSGQDSSNKNIIGNCYRNNIASYFGRYGRNIISSMDANIISANYQFNINIGNNMSNNKVLVSMDQIHIASVFNNNSIIGQFNNITLSGNCSLNEVLGSVSLFTGGTFEFNVVLGILSSSSFLGTMRENQINNGGIVIHTDFGEGFRNNVLSSMDNCTFNQNVGEYTQYNIFNNINGIDFTGATHVKEEYKCDVFMREGGVGVLSYVDNTNTLQIVAANA